MSNVINKYIDVDSTYRNRKLYPLASDFVMPVTFNSRGTSVFLSQDPVILGIPYELNKLGAVTVGAPPHPTINLGAAFKNQDNLYTNSYLEVNPGGGFSVLVTNPDYYLITDYVGSTRIATVSPSIPFPGVSATDYVSIRKQLPVLRDTLPAGCTTTTIILGAGANILPPGGFVNSVIRFLTIGGVISDVYGILKSYDIATNSYTLYTPLASAPVATDLYEIVQFSYDNYNPIVYSGTTTMTQPVCYSIELLYITLPNTTILNGNRGYLDTYSYFYVKLYNENKNSSNHILYSNNPNTEFAIFKVPMTIVLRDEQFFTLRDSKCIQVIKFQPEQAIRFTVTLPNGEPIVFSTPDYYSPNVPNPYLQISASFAIRRIDG